MEDFIILNDNGEQVSLEDAAREVSRMAEPMVLPVEFHGRTEWTLDRLREINHELGTLNYAKVEKILAGARRHSKKNIVREWVKVRVLKALEEIPVCGDGMKEVTDLDTFMKAWRNIASSEITDDIIDTMYAAQRHGIQ